MNDQSAGSTAIIDRKEEAVRVACAEARTKIHDRLRQYSWSELGTPALDREWADVLEKGVWLEDRVTEILSSYPHELPVEDANDLFFEVIDAIRLRVWEDRNHLLKEARQMMLREADQVRIRVTRSKIEIKDLHRTRSKL